MRFVTATLDHEANVFSTLKGTIEYLKTKALLLYDEEVIKYFKGTRTNIGAFIDASSKLGFELIPTVYARFFAYGAITKEADEFVLGEILDRVKRVGAIDGLLLFTHGAGYTEKHPDLEGHYFSELRRLVGRDVPIASTFDWHANYTKQMMDNIDIITGEDTYPHIDSYDRALEAAELLVKMVKKEIKPTKVLEKPPILVTAQAQFTERPPIKTLIDMAHEFEKEEKVLNVTIAGGFPWSDSKDPTLGIVVTTDNDPALAGELAKKLSDFIWTHRTELLVRVTPVKEAVNHAIQAKEGPIVLADIGDNPGCGAAGDGTVLLKALIEMGAKNAVYGAICDPQAVVTAIEAGVGKEVNMMVGGKIDNLHGPPLKVRGTVVRISDGKVTYKGPMEKGQVKDLGRTVLLDCNGVQVVLTEKRTQPNDLEFYRILGIDPTEKKILAVKSSVHYRASHGPIAKEIIEVDTPGLSSPRLAGLPFKNLKRPIFPLDLEMLGLVELKTMEEE